MAAENSEDFRNWFAETVVRIVLERVEGELCVTEVEFSDGSPPLHPSSARSSSRAARQSLGKGLGSK